MIPGGIADKLGNEYEAYWTLSQVLRVIQGLASAIRVEPFDDDARGFEFWLTEGDVTQWHQCKRVSSGSWTINAMERHGVLQDFARKLAAEKTECVFVTSAPVIPFRSLTEKAKLTESTEAFLASLNDEDEKGLQTLYRIWGSSAAHSGLNSQRGVAYRVLAKMLWHDEGLYKRVIAFMQTRIALEPLRSVRTQMFDVINAISKYDAAQGIILLWQMAAKDLHALASRYSFDVLTWASHNYPETLLPLIELMITNESEHLQAVGVFLLSGVALGDADGEKRLLSLASDNQLARRMTAFRAAGNISSDEYGKRAARWIIPYFHDDHPLVRDEASHCNWESILTPNSGNVSLASDFVASPAFHDHPGNLTSALTKFVDIYPDLTMQVVEEIVTTLDRWRINNNRDLYTVIHELPRMMVNLYRRMEADASKEKTLLDLFDAYLARDLYEIRSAISAYERH